MNPLWCGPDNTHGFVLDEKFYRLRWANTQTLTEYNISNVDLMHVQLRYYRLELCWHSGEEVMRPS